jgi:hypothetical protein
MKRSIAAAATALAAAASFGQTSVGVSIAIQQPGVYGRIDIGNLPPAAVLYPQPVVIAPTPVAVYQRPIYLYVPVAHQHDWRRYCGRYAACGQPVYFVREDWVRDRYEEHHHHGGGEHKENQSKKSKGKHGNG